ncbi:MAG: hypothetical protein AAF108_00470 [Planctomycetota bacterium]
MFAPAAFLLLVTSAVGAAAQDDPVAAYLEERSLDRLLVAHLEDRIERSAASADTRRLSEAYTRLLSRSEDPDQAEADRLDAQRLLSRLDPGDPTTFRLRLAAEESRMRSAADGVEAAQFGTAGVALLRRTAVKLSEAAEALGDITAYASNRVQRLNNELEAGRTTIDDRPVDEVLGESREILAFAAYRGGIAAYQLAMVRQAVGADASAAAKDARRRFGWIFDQRRGQLPDVSDIDPNRLRSAGNAGTSLFIAACYAMEGDRVRADAWLDLAESAPDPPEPVRRLVELTRVRVLCESDRFIDLARRFEQTPPEAPVARLALALAARRAEAPTEGSVRQGIARIAQATLAELIRDGYAREIAAIVERVDDGIADRDAFAVLYTRALATLDRLGLLADGPASPLAGTDRSGRTGVDRRDLERCERRLRRALEAEDVGDFPGAVAETHAHLAVVAAAAENWPDAARSFLTAAELAPDDESARRLLQTAILTLPDDLPASAEPSVARDRLIAHYLRRFRSTRFGSQLIVAARALRDTGEPRDELDALLNVPPSDPAYTSARVIASGVLRELLAAAPPDRASRLRETMLDVTRQAIRGVRRRLRSSPQPGDDQRLPALAAQAIATVFESPAPDLVLVRTLLDETERDLSELGITPASSTRAALDDARVRLALAAGDRATLDEILRRARDAGGSLAIRQLTAVLREAEAQRRQAPEAAAPARRALALAEELITLLGAAPARDPDRRWIYQSAAAAAFTIYEDEATTASERAAFADRIVRLDRRSQTEPPTRAALRRLAVLSEGRGDARASLDAWRRLRNASTENTRGWFEAKYHTIRLALTLEPEVGLGQLERHAALYPTWGPEPWGPLIERLRRTAGTASSPRPLEGYRRKGDP